MKRALGVGVVSRGCRSNVGIFFGKRLGDKVAIFSPRHPVTPSPVRRPSIYPSQKNLRKNIGTAAKGNGDRVVRNFANAVVRARTEWLEAGGHEDAEWEPWRWPESFVKNFNHMVFHLQGVFFALSRPMFRQRFVVLSGRPGAVAARARFFRKFCTE